MDTHSADSDDSPVTTSVLVVDDEESMRWVLSRALEKGGFNVLTAGDGLAALEIAERENPQAYVMDIRMPHLDGLEALRRLREKDPLAAVIMMTAKGTMKTAVEAMRQGAFNYLTKPFDMEEVVVMVEKALKARNEAEELNQLRFQVGERYDTDQIIGNSLAMQEVYKTIGKVADHDVTVLIQGESGTGKELVARAIHHAGARNSYPFVPVNCAAIPEHLLESELFGHTKGAFTGAIANRVGKFQEAGQGTIFLDEVGELPLGLQAKLLRALQERNIEPVGSSQSLPVMARVISATNQNIQSLVDETRFRSDLFFRLNVVPVSLPPLRDRSQDIPELVEYFLHRIGESANLPIKSVTAEALEYLKQQPWPGNVRELENALKRFVFLDPSRKLTLENLATVVSGSYTGADGASGSMEELLAAKLRTLVGTGDQTPHQTLLSDVEELLIQEAIRMTKGNRLRAAKLLGINRNTLAKKLSEYEDISE